MGRSTVRRWLAALRHDAPRRVHAGPAVTLKSPGDLPWRGLVIRRDTARLFAARHLPGVPWLLEDAGP